MKLCVIGNSHVAALRSALGSQSTLAEHAIDFYALPGGRQPDVEIVDGLLTPVAAPQGVLTTVDGAATGGLVLANHDLLVISACGMIAARNGHVVPDPTLHPCGSVVVAGWDWEQIALPAETRMVSSAVYEAVVEDHVRAHASARLLVRLSQCFDGPVLIQPWPAPNRGLRADAEWFVNARYRRLGPAVWAAFFAAQRRALVTIAEELGPRFSFLDYPARTSSSADGFMDGTWCDLDPWHGNAAYGALVLDQIVERLEKPLAAAAADTVVDGPAR